MVLPVGSIFSSTALATRQREVKDVADNQVVYITENGHGAYIFCSEEVFSRELESAREEARYEAEMLIGLADALRDVNNGDVETDLKKFRESVLSERGING